MNIEDIHPPKGTVVEETSPGEGRMLTGRVSHFATCPKASEFRKTKGDRS